MEELIKIISEEPQENGDVTVTFECPTYLYDQLVEVYGTEDFEEQLSRDFNELVRREYIDK